MIDYCTEVVEPVTFPRGTHQLLGWCYSMQGVDPHERTAHDKLMERMNDGEIRPFSLAGINVKGLSNLEKYGLAAGIRQKVEEIVTYAQRCVIWAKYCDKSVPEKLEGMTGVVDAIHQSLRRGRPLVADEVWHVVCTDKDREACTLYAIGKRHSTGIMNVCRDVKKIREYMREVEGQAAVIIKAVFSTDGVL